VLRTGEIRGRSLKELLSQQCAACANDSAFQSGMAGAARCQLIERASLYGLAGREQPVEWALEPNGGVSCSAFSPDEGTWSVTPLS
jgi:hypothetical protein